MYKAVFFDLDDTLIDALECHVAAEKFALEHSGYSFEESEKKTRDLSFMGVRTIDIMRIRLERLGVSDVSSILPKVYADREQFMREHLPEYLKLMPGAKEAVEYCHTNNLVTAIVSSGTKSYIDTCLQIFQLQNSFTFIISGEDVHKGKPDPEIYMKAYTKVNEKYGFTKQECLAVEDADAGVVSAQSAGLPVCFIPSVGATKTLDVEYCINSLMNFESILSDNSKTI